MLRSLPSVLIACCRHARINSYGIKFQLRSCTFIKSNALCSGKDFPVSSQPIPAQKLYSADTDILYEQLRRSRFIPQLFELTSKHLDIMNIKHIVASFEVIHDNLKQRGLLQGKSEELANLRDSKAFQALCDHTLSRIRYMEPSDVITVFKVLSLLGIQNNTFIMQSILKMLCTKINDLSLSELTFLDFLLSRQQPNPATDALKMALPLVFQAEIENQLDLENVPQMVDCLKLCSRARLKPATLQKIVSALLTKTDVLTGDQAITMIFCLLNQDTPVDGYLELLNNAFHVAANNIEKLKAEQVLHTVRLCCKFSFFHGGFLVASAKKAVLEKWNLAYCYQLQKYLHHFLIFHQELLDLLCEHIVSNPEEVRTNKRFSPVSFASYFAVTDYHHPELQKALEILCTVDDKLSVMLEELPFLYTRFVSCLSVLGHFPERIFQHALNESFLTKALSVSRKIGKHLELEKNICTLLWSIEAHEQKSRFQVPSTIREQTVESVISRHKQSREYPLMLYLENGLGGSQFFCTGMSTRSGHFIDHAIVVRTGNFPVSLSSVNGLSGLKPSEQTTYIEDLCLPDDAKIVTIIVADEDSYCKEPSLLKSWNNMKCLSLFKMNYYPILINYPVWSKLPDREKIPHLMREIKQVLEVNDPSKSNMPLHFTTV